MFTRSHPDFLCLHDWLATNPDWTTRIFVVNSIMTMYSDIHRMGIYHVDIKPDHIFVGNDARVRIIDFNYSVIKGVYKNPSWTLPYIAPEINKKTIDWEKWDLFVLGLIMIYILTGQEYSTSDYYFDDHSIRRLTHCFKEDLRYWVQEIMEKTKNYDCVDISFLLRINPTDRRMVIHKRM
jgi:serine/threonine protein kinase